MSYVHVFAKGEEYLNAVLKAEKANDLVAAKELLQQAITIYKQGLLVIHESKTILRQGVQQRIESYQTRLAGYSLLMRGTSSLASSSHDNVDQKQMDQVVATKQDDDRVKLTWDDVVGLEEVKRMVQDTLKLSVKYASVYGNAIQAISRILFYGMPGTGKTYVAQVIADVSGAQFFNPTTADIKSKLVGEGEKFIKQLFQEARRAKKSVICIDEIDSIISERGETQTEASIGIKTELLIELSREQPGVLFIAATNHPWFLEAAFLSRMQERIYLRLPNEKETRTIVAQYISKHHLQVSLSTEDETWLFDRLKGMSNRDIAEIFKLKFGLGIARALESTTEWVLYENGSYQPYCAALHQPSIQSKQLSYKNHLSVDDILPNTPKWPVLTRLLLENILKEVKSSVRIEDLVRYEEWTLTYGTDGKQ